MANQNLKVKSANRFIVMLDGKQVGLLQSVDLRDDFGPEPASGIGDIHVREWVPTMARHDISVEEMVLNVGALRDQGITLENGDAALNGITFDIVVQNKDTGLTLRKYVGCSYASGSVTVRKHSIIVSSAMFHALDVTGAGA